MADRVEHRVDGLQSRVDLDRPLLLQQDCKVGRPHEQDGDEGEPLEEGGDGEPGEQPEGQRGEEVEPLGREPHVAVEAGGGVAEVAPELGLAAGQGDGAEGDEGGVEGDELAAGHAEVVDVDEVAVWKKNWKGLCFAYLLLMGLILAMYVVDDLAC